MENYNFWQDFFDTYQSLSDWMKFVWLVAPLAFALGLVALILRYRLNSKRAGHGIDGKLIYSIHRNEQNQFHIFRHKSVTEVQQELEYEPTLLLLDRENSDRVKQQSENGRP